MWPAVHTFRMDGFQCLKPRLLFLVCFLVVATGSDANPDTGDFLHNSAEHDWDDSGSGHLGSGREQDDLYHSGEHVDDIFPEDVGQDTDPLNQNPGLLQNY